jgi:hypothetical protein
VLCTAELVRRRAGEQVADGDARPGLGEPGAAASITVVATKVAVLVGMVERPTLR